MLAVLVAATAGCRTAPPIPAAAEPGESADLSEQPASDPSDLALPGAVDPDEPAAPEPPRRPPPAPVADLPGALQALATGNPEGAATFLEGLLRKKPGDERVRLALAHAHLATGALDQAAAVLESKQGPGSSARTRLLARMRAQRGDLQGAIALLDKLTADPADLPARGELLSLLVAAGKDKDPRAVSLREALYDAYDAGKAKSVEQLVAVARAALARGTTGAFHDANMVLGEAENLPLETDSLEPGFVLRDRALLLRGAMFREKYAAAEAIATYDIILQRDPWHPDALAGVAAAHLEELRLAAAADAAGRALQVNPRHPEALAVLAKIALVEGRRDEAIARAEKELLAVSPDHPDGLAVVAGAALARDDAGAYARLRDQAAAGGNPVPFWLALADILVSMHLYEQAETVLAEAAARAPDNAYVQSAHGLNLLRLGREPEGRAALKAAWKRDRFNARTRNTLDLYDQRIDPLYTDVVDGDVSLRLLKEDQEYVSKDMLAIIARARAVLDQRYALRPTPLRIEVFADPGDFSIRTIGVPSLGAVGVCFGRLITAVGPYHGTHNFHQVIWHELAHVYAVQLSKGRVPRWFTEGLSEWESELADPSWARESAELLAAARRKNALRRLSELELAFLRAGSAQAMEVAYTTAAYAVRYLGETYGLPRLIAILKGYGDGLTTEVLFERHLGKPLAVIEKEFETWLFGQLDAKIKGWEPAKARGDRPDERDELLADALAQARKKDLTAAARTLQQLIQGRGDGYVPRMTLAEVLMQGPSWKQAGEHYLKARGFRPEAIEPIIRLAELARREGDVAREKQLLREGLAIDGTSYDPAARLAMLAVVTGDADMRDFALARATAIAPLHPLTLAGQALQAAAAGDKARARSLSDRALKNMNDGPLSRGPVDTLVVLALAAEAAGDLTRARILAARAGAEPQLPQPAKQAMNRLLQAK
ncbi:MAG TPA: tetratricopeptide repeat protein [Nannocystis sp.]